MACLCLPSALWNSLNDWAMKCGCFPRIAAANQSTITSVFDINQGDRPKIQKNNAGIRAILLVSKHLCQKLSIMIQLFHIRYGYTHKKTSPFQAFTIFIVPSIPRRLITLRKLYARKESPISAATFTFPLVNRYPAPCHRFTVPYGCSTIVFRFLRCF